VLGYLAGRFSDRARHSEKLEQLHRLLKEKCSEVGAVAAEVAQRERLLRSYVSPNTAKWLDRRAEDLLDPRLLAALETVRRAGAGGGPGGGGVDRTVLREVAESVFQFPCLRPDVCEELLEEVGHFMAWSKEMVRRGVPGSAHLQTKLCVLDHLGAIGPRVLDVLQEALVHPLARALFPHTCPTHPAEEEGGGAAEAAAEAEVEQRGGGGQAGEGAASTATAIPQRAFDGACRARTRTTPSLPPTDYRYGFSIGYASDPTVAVDGRHVSRQGLVPHTDDSEISLTVRLGRSFQGGEVVLRHLKDDPRAGQEQHRVAYETGQGTLFYGQQFHEVEPVTSGERQMLVVWFRSQPFRDVSCPCCTKRRRFGNCVMSLHNN
jgi:hypothetical protein